MSTIYIDKNRFLIKEASKEKIIGEWKEAVDEIIETCNKHLGIRFISLYIGGSVAHGKAIENKSDIDSYVIVSLNKEEIEKNIDSWVKNEQKRLNLLFPFQRGIQINLIPVNQIPEGKKFQIKVFSAYVYGKDFSQELSGYKLDKETIGRVRVNIEKDIEIARKKLTEAEDENNVKKVSVWIAKRLIRSAGMMCMWKGNFFTMDIENLVKIFTSNYPEKNIEIHKLFKYIENPPSDKKTVLNMLESFGTWLINEDRQVFKSILL